MGEIFYRGNCSLPELSDGRSDVVVDGAGERRVGRQDGAVGAAGGLGVLGATELGVPPVVARRPRQRGVERAEQVVESPGEDHDVVDVEPGGDDGCRVADSCRVSNVSDYTKMIRR